MVRHLNFNFIPMMSFSLSQSPPLPIENLQQRIQQLLALPNGLTLSPNNLQRMVSLMDLTSLNSSDTEQSISLLCQKALQPSLTVHALPQVAAVCIYPQHLGTAIKLLHASPVRVATVAGGFPLGNSATAQKLSEVKEALQWGADEIDMVLNRDLLLSGEYMQVHDDIAAIKACCGPIPLKVILETGALPTFELVRLASQIAIAAGADFIKTSTGKIAQGASLEAVLVMLDAIKEEYARSGKKIGLKPSGGISNAKSAIDYLKLTQHILGPEWLQPNLFRFGASSLLGDVLRELGE